MLDIIWLAPACAVTAGIWFVYRLGIEAGKDQVIRRVRSQYPMQDVTGLY
jgi:hypothetical protein